MDEVRSLALRLQARGMCDFEIAGELNRLGYRKGLNQDGSPQRYTAADVVKLLAV